MSKLWRPNNWVNPYPNTNWDEGLQHEGFEEGADAMLESLKIFNSPINQKRRMIIMSSNDELLHRLRVFANCTCYRCSKIIPFSQAEFIPQPSFPESELCLCYRCFDIYKSIKSSTESSNNDTLISCLNELKPTVGVK